MLKVPSLSCAFVFTLLLACTRPQDPSSADAGLFVSVRIPESLMPLQRGQKYEVPLEETLGKRHLGELLGGGSQLGEKKPDGTHDVKFVSLDIELKDANGLPVLRQELKRLGAPEGTTLHYELGGKRVSEPL